MFRQFARLGSILSLFFLFPLKDFELHRHGWAFEDESAARLRQAMSNEETVSVSSFSRGHEARQQSTIYANIYSASRRRYISQCEGPESDTGSTDVLECMYRCVNLASMSLCEPPTVHRGRISTTAARVGAGAVAEQHKEYFLSLRLHFGRPDNDKGMAW